MSRYKFNALNIYMIKHLVLTISAYSINWLNTVNVRVHDYKAPELRGLWGQEHFPLIFLREP